MAALVRRGARVAVLTGPPGDATSGARISGFADGAGDAASRSSRRPRRTSTGARRRSRPRRCCPTTTRIAGIFAANDLMALGAATAVEAAGREGEIAVIGVDGIEEALSAIRRGAMSATVAQYPYTIGQLGVQACLAAVARQADPVAHRRADPGRHARQRRARASEVPGAAGRVRQPARRAAAMRRPVSFLGTRSSSAAGWRGPSQPQRGMRAPGGTAVSSAE